jgi:hypothetical protein
MDQEQRDRERKADEVLEKDQRGKGYGEDEGERESALEDE